MKAAIISALVASVISAGSATAAFVVTSKNIKNGTIQMVDMSRQAKAALRGQRGRQGPQGPTGPQGDHGVVGTTLAEGDLVTLQPNEQGVSTATCPQGKVTGGGWHGPSGSSLVILRNFPLNASPSLPTETWNVIAVNVSPTAPVTFAARAVCAY